MAYQETRTGKSKLRFILPRPPESMENLSQRKARSPQVDTVSQQRLQSTTPTTIDSDTSDQKPPPHIESTNTSKHKAEEMASMDEVLAAKLAKSQSDLFYSCRFADVIVKCGEREWKLHQSVLCLRCDHFNTILTTQRPQPAEPQDEAGDSKLPVIDLSTEDPRALDAVFRYLYTLDISPFRPFSTEGIEMETVFSTNVRITYNIFLLAQKYDLPELGIATRGHLAWLIQVTLSRFEAFDPAHRFEWTGWILELWDLDVDATAPLKKVVQNTLSALKVDVWKCEEMEDLIRDNPGFACAMVGFACSKANANAIRVHQLSQGQPLWQSRVRDLEEEVNRLKAEACEYDYVNRPKRARV